MKKTQKKIFGFFGLSAVIAMTAFALALPNPEASAASSVTDTITVIVRSVTPNVEIDGIESGDVIVGPEKNITVDYDNVDTIEVVLKYTDTEGHERVFELVNGPVSGMPKPLSFSFNFDDPQYGYGKYVLTVTGKRDGDGKDIDSIEFSYAAFSATLDDDTEDGKTYVDLDYTPDDGTEQGKGNVSKIIINVYDEKGNIVSQLSPITVLAPENRVEIPFDKYDLAAGTYRIAITAYNRNNEELYNRELKKKIEQEIPVPDAGSPDTGGLFKNISVSQSDFLFTGLIAFFMVGIVGIIIVSKRDKKSNKRR